MNIVLSCILVIVVVYTYLDLDNRQRHETHRGKWIDVIDCSIDNNGNTTQECNIRPPHFGAGHSYEGPRDQRVESETQEGELGKKQVYKSESILKKGYTWNRFNRYLKKTRDRIFQIAPKASAKTSKKELENPDYSFKKWIRFPWKHGTFDYTKFKKREFIPKIIDKWFPDDDYKQVRINYMYEVSNENMDFVKTLKAENWQMMLHLQSFCHQWWKRERSYWLCQLNYRRHKAFIESDDWDKRYAQINYCRDVRDDAVNKKRLRSTFYWYSARKWAWAKVVLIK